MPTMLWAASTCMVAPMDKGKSVVSKRSGNPTSADGKGESQTQGEGLEFATTGAQPVYATTDGVVTFVGYRGSTGNTLLIQRPNGDMVGYHHLSAFTPGIRQGNEVKAGQQIGLSGNDRLHFVYGPAEKNETRAKKLAEKTRTGLFNQGQLSVTFEKQESGSNRVDPSPYFCEPLPVQETDDAKTQRAAAQKAAAKINSDNFADTLDPRKDYGSFPKAGVGDDMSYLEMLLTESNRRFSDVSWSIDLTKLSMRALRNDYARVQGIKSVLNERIYRKKEKIEALMAVYTSLKLENERAATRLAHERAMADYLKTRVD